MSHARNRRQVARLTYERDKLVRKNIELALEVEVLHAKLMARARVRNGVDRRHEPRIN